MNDQLSDAMEEIGTRFILYSNQVDKLHEIACVLAELEEYDTCGETPYRYTHKILSTLLLDVLEEVSDQPAPVDPVLLKKLIKERKEQAD